MSNMVCYCATHFNHLNTLTLSRLDGIGFSNNNFSLISASGTCSSNNLFAYFARSPGSSHLYSSSLEVILNLLTSSSSELLEFSEDEECDEEEEERDLFFLRFFDFFFFLFRSPSKAGSLIE